LRFEVFKTVKMSVVDFYVLMTCGFVGGVLSLRRNILPPSSTLKYVPPKRWYPSQVHTAFQPRRPPWQPDILHKGLKTKRK
jgi:hypothetical protein